MDIYIDVFGKRAVTGANDPTPLPVPDFRTPGSYTVNLYFLIQSTIPGSYNYVRYASNSLKLNLRMDAPPDYARFTVSYRGYETSPIDVSLTNAAITKLVEALPSVGVGNVRVTGDKVGGWTLEFIGGFAGQTVSLFTGRIVSSTPSAEIFTKDTTVVPTPVGRTSALAPAPPTKPPNTTQFIRVRQAPLATVTAWTEIGMPTTPGWQGTLNTASVPLSTWDNPLHDIILEVVNAPVNRNGSDGVTVSDGIGHSGSGGQITASTGTTNTAMASGGIKSFLIAADNNGVYGRKFVPGDVGRAISDAGGFIPAGTIILEVMDDGITNSALLSQQFNPGFPASTTYTTGDLPSDVFYDGAATFSPNDVGHVLSGSNIAAGTRVIGFISPSYIRMNTRGLAIASGIAWSIASDLSAVFNSASAAFTLSDVGAKIRAPSVLPQTAVITRYIDATHVELSVRPTSAATGVAWSLIPERAYPPPGAGHAVLGDLATQEKQQFVLPQIPVGGYLLLQDGYGTPMPLAMVATPITAGGIKSALDNVYPNYGNIGVEEIIPQAKWQVTWGVLGQQRLLVVNDANIVYEEAILSWLMQGGSGLPQIFSIGSQTPITSPPIVTLNGLVYIGATSVSQQWIVGNPNFTRTSDGTRAKLMSQRVLNFSGNYNPPNLNDGLGNYGGDAYYFIGDDIGEERAGMVVHTQRGATIPASRQEIHQQQRSMIGIARTFNGNLLVDMQLFSVSQSRSIAVNYTYGTGQGGLVQPPDGPAGALIHYINGAFGQIALGGFQQLPSNVQVGDTHAYGTFDVFLYWSWSRRRWMGDIWEQSVFYG